MKRDCSGGIVKFCESSSDFINFIDVSLVTKNEKAKEIEASTRSALLELLSQFPSKFEISCC